MLSIFCVTLLLLCVFSSAGYIFFLLLHYEPRNIFQAIFLGLFFIGILGMIVSIFLPLKLGVSLLCFSPALFGASSFIKRLRQYYIETSLAGCTLSVIALLAVTAMYSFVAADATWSGIAYDTDLYHAQTIRWLNEYGTVAGVGNLHSRLANISLWYVLAALLNHVALSGSVAWHMMPLFLTAFTMFILCEVFSGKNSSARAYCACILPISAYAIIPWGHPNLYSDFPSLALVCIIGAEMIYFLYDEYACTPQYAAYICILVTLSFLIKSLPIVTVIFIPLFILYILYKRHTFTWKRACLILCVPACAAFVFCWSNVILSGYPFFPLTIFPLHVDWKMSEDAVLQNALDVRAWARMPGPQYLIAYDRGITFWFGPWLDRMMTLQKNQFILMMTPLTLGCICWLIVRKHLMCVIEFFLLCWPTISIVYWFVLAPDPRFGTEYFWLFFALSMAIYIRNCAMPLKQKFPKIAGSWQSLYIVGISCFFLSIFTFYGTRNSPQKALIQPGKIVALPSHIHSIHPVNESSFDLYVPDVGDKCGDAPLPCTGVAPAKPDTLRLQLSG